MVASPVLSAVTIDLPLLASGCRVSKVGNTVVKSANDGVPTLDDLIVTPNDNVSFAVLPIGGLLPHSASKLRGKHLVLGDDRMEALKALPEFKYGS